MSDHTPDRSVDPADLHLTARLLADSLRAAPATLLYGGAAWRRRALLAEGVLPLLARRGGDLTTAAAAAGDLVGSTNGHGAGPVNRMPGSDEWVVVIDDWPIADEPLVPLAQRLAVARATRMVSSAGGPAERGRVLLVLMDVDRAVARAAQTDASDPFWTELRMQVRRGVRVLVVADRADTPGLRWLRQLLPALGERVLSLDDPLPRGLRRLAPAPEAAVTPEPAPPATEATASDQSWLDSVHSAVRQVSAQSRGETSSAPGRSPRFEAALRATAARPIDRDPPWHAPVVDDAPVTEPAIAPASINDRTVAAAPARTPATDPVWADLAASPSMWVPDIDLTQAHPALEAAPEQTSARNANGAPSRRTWSPVVLAVALMAGAGAGAALWRAQGGDFDQLIASDPPSAGAETAATSTPAEPAAPAPREAVGGSAAEPVAEPASASMPAPEATPVVAPAPVASDPAQDTASATPVKLPPGVEPGEGVRLVLAGLPVADMRRQRAATAAPGAATLAIIRADAVSSVPGKGVQMVAPLFVEPIQVWVLADSRWRTWDDLGVATVDVGQGGAGARTARNLPAAAFGLPDWQRPSDNWRELADRDALGALYRREVDAVLRVGQTPLSAGAAAGVAQGQLRLLTLDAGVGSGTLRNYVPTALTSPRGARTPGVPTLLVVQGGDSAARDALAVQAVRALCAEQSALRAAAPRGAWLKPGSPLSGRSALPAAREAAGRCDPTG